MRISVEFDSIEEFEAFRTSGRATRARTKKEEAEEAAAEPAKPEADVPAPLQPPATSAPVFAPQAQPAAPAPAFGAPAAPAVDPAVADLVGKICARWNESVAAQPATGDAALKFFRDNVGNAGATKEQIQGVLLAQLPLDALKKIAGLVGIAA